jgi:hypothetical protein
MSFTWLRRRWGRGSGSTSSGGGGELLHTRGPSDLANGGGGPLLGGSAVRRAAARCARLARFLVFLARFLCACVGYGCFELSGARHSFPAEGEKKPKKRRTI